MTKKWVVILVILVLLVGVVFYAYHSSTPSPSSANLQNVTIAQAFQVFLYAPLYVAQNQGFFKDQGLNVNITTAGGDQEAFAALLSGDAQFAVGDPTFTAISGEKGQPGVVLASVLSGVPFWGVAKSNVPVITSPAMLKGYKIATYPAPNTAYELQLAMFKSANLQPNIVQIAPGGLLPALAAGKVDIALELEPNVSTAIANGDHIVYSLSSYYPTFALTGLTALPSYVQNNSSTAQKIVNALKQADDYIRANPTSTADFLGTMFQVSSTIAESAVQNMLAAKVIPDSLVVDPAGWSAAIQLQVETGDLKQTEPYSTYVNTTFAQQAMSSVQ
jgi:NitT/TauT family transport system substrate-binding protein